MTAQRATLPESTAPWAEIVPGAPYPMTIDDLVAWPDDDSYRYELVEGVLVRMAGSGNRATTLAADLIGALVAYARPRRLGRVTSSDGVYVFPGAETGLLPDVGFYTAEKRALIMDQTKPLPFAPDLAIEVASPKQTADQMAAKARTYLGGGTHLVWVLWPEDERVDVWRAGRSANPAAVLYAPAALDGEAILPGFSYPVADVFADPLA